MGDGFGLSSVVSSFLNGQSDSRNSHTRYIFFYDIYILDRK